MVSSTVLRAAVAMFLVLALTIAGGATFWWIKGAPRRLAEIRSKHLEFLAPLHPISRQCEYQIVGLTAKDNDIHKGTEFTIKSWPDWLTRRLRKCQLELPSYLRQPTPDCGCAIHLPRTSEDCLIFRLPTGEEGWASITKNKLFICDPVD